VLDQGVGDDVEGAHGGLIGLRRLASIVCGGGPGWCNEVKQEACRALSRQGALAVPACEN
jgi:hypothetical protein